MGAACGTAASGCADGSCSVGSTGGKGDCGCDSCAIQRFAGRGYPRLVGGATLPGVQYGAPKVGRAFAQPVWSAAGAVDPGASSRVRPSGATEAEDPWYADVIEQGLHELGETVREYSPNHTADDTTNDDTSDGQDSGNQQSMDALAAALDELNASKGDTEKAEGLTTGEKFAIGGAVVVVGGVIVYEAMTYKGRRGRRS